MGMNYLLECKKNTEVSENRASLLLILGVLSVLSETRKNLQQPKKQTSD